ncbi:hypothetical protein HKX48_006944, partial [Thoreauomyces humboldtii]
MSTPADPLLTGGGAADVQISVTGGDNVKISDLAASTRKPQSASLTYRFKIPLLILAPLLIVSALTAVILPVCMVLVLSSKQSTTDLSALYFANLLNDTQIKVNNSVASQRYAVNAFGSLPATSLAMGSSHNLLGEKPTWQLMAHITKTYGLDATQCYTATFKPSAGSNPSINFNTTQITQLQISHSLVAPTTNPALGITDLSFPGGLHQYALNQTSLELANSTWPQFTKYPNDLTFSRGILELLQPIPKMGQIFGSTLNQQGLRGATILQAFNFASPTNISTLYACGATLVVDSAWNALLQEAAGSGTQTVILLLDNTPAINLISTSNRHLSYAQALSGGNSTETLSASLRTAVLAHYGGSYNTSIATASTSFETSVEGTTFIVLTGSVALTAYAEDNLVLVIATPRAAIFSTIDSARTRSVAIAVGLSVGLAVVMACIFALIVTPLRHLAGAMGLLTQMDFSALDSGKVLEVNSHISE